MPSLRIFLLHAILFILVLLPTSSFSAKFRANIHDFAWMAGTWEGEIPAGKVETIWSEPQSGLMMGSFRLYNATETMVLEFMSLREKLNSVELCIRHFSPDMQAWEKENPLTLPLLHFDPSYSAFVNSANNSQPVRIVITPKGENEFLSDSYIESATGKRKISVGMKRVDPAKKPALPKWGCYVTTYGKGGGVNKLAMAHPLSYYQETIIPLDSELAWLRNDNHLVYVKQVNELDTIAGRRVYEIRLALDEPERNSIQIILLQRDGDLYSPIYYMNTVYVSVEWEKTWIENENQVVIRLLENAQIRGPYDTRITITPDGPRFDELAID